MHGHLFELQLPPKKLPIPMWIPLLASSFFKSLRQCWCVTCVREKIFKTTPEWVWLSQTGQEKNIKTNVTLAKNFRLISYFTSHQINLIQNNFTVLLISAKLLPYKNEA